MKKYILFSILIITLFSCKKEEDIPAQEVGSLDVAEAKLMMVVGTSGGSNNQYYKITNTNEVKKVKMYDQFGVELDGINAFGVFNVHENFYMMFFTHHSAANFFMLNKTTYSQTDLYDYGLPVYYNGMGDMNSNFFRNDSSQNIYFISEKSGNKNILS